MQFQFSVYYFICRNPLLGDEIVAHAFDRNRLIGLVVPRKCIIFYYLGNLPNAASTLISGSKESLRFLSKSPRPLKIERMIIIAAVMMLTETTEIIEITLMKFFFRFEKRYRLATK
jgi:hypothetical protein